MKKSALFMLGLLAVSPLFAAPQGTVPTESMGSHYKTPEEKAMDFFSRGMKAKRKAEGETDAAKKAKLYLKAKEELSKSVGYVGHYDGYLALGQVYLALGQQESGLDACTRAQSLKPSDEAARGCVEQARQAIQAAQTKSEPNGG
jgi:cytochrome c-type biogenesis protein CcmH/NrfG